MNHTRIGPDASNASWIWRSERSQKPLDPLGTARRRLQPRHTISARSANPGRPKFHAGLFEHQPDGAVVSAELVADAAARPALVIQLDALGDLVFGEGPRPAHIVVGEELGDGAAVHAESLCHLVGAFTAQVPLKQLGLLVSAQTSLPLSWFALGLGRRRGGRCL